MSNTPEICRTEKGSGPNRRARANELQRERRKRFKRLDFYASAETVEIIDSLRKPRVDGTASAIINRIIGEWADASGITRHSLTRAREG